MSGAATGWRPALLRGALSAAEPLYATTIAARNRLYDRRWIRINRLPRPVISIGNLTTGGTGKTPMVRWLAETLRSLGMTPAILSRGYRSTGTSLGDELEMLDRQLNNGPSAPVFVRANSDRFEAGRQVLREHPEIGVFILDDGFQHRRLARDVDLVLVSAVAPFGFGHVLPRGLLREPVSGLRRADAVVITHADQASHDQLIQIEQRVRQVNTDIPVYRAVHAHTALQQSDGRAVPISGLAGRRVFVFCGIGDPHTFEGQLRATGTDVVGSRFFADHYAYGDSDAAELHRDAIRCGAEALVTTEKDWVKLSHLRQPLNGLPVWRVDVRIRFEGADERLLLEQLLPRLSARRDSQ